MNFRSMRANGFKTFIVSGGGIEFMRPWTEKVYGFPTEQVVGSSIQTQYEIRDGKPWINDTRYGVEWRNFKMVLVLQKTMTDPVLHLATPHLVNLDTDPRERKPYDYPYVHSWVVAHTGKLLQEFEGSVRREPLIPVGAPLDYVPKQKQQ